MPANFKARSWRIGLVLAIVVLLAGGLYLTRFQESEAFPSMPADEQDYWSWVTTINRGSDEALEVGVSLLSEHPHLERLYLRLADLCLEEKSPETCTTAFDHAEPPSPLAELYRDAARAKLVADPSPEEARPLWLYLAATPDLDPGIARMIVDAARANAEDDWTDHLGLTWERTLNAEPSRAGAAFGLGYLAVLRGDWTRGEEYLTRTTTLLPDDPEAYRELGRIYYTTGRPDDFEAALTRGIDAARARHELEKELILRGNLGLGVKQRGDLARAEQIFHTALENSRAIRDEETEGFNLYRLASIRIQQFRHYEALQLLEQAASLYAKTVPRRAPEVLAQKGVVFRDLFRFSDSEALLEQTIADAQEVFNVEAELHAYVALASLQYQMGRFEASLQTARKLLRLGQSTGHVDSQITGQMILGDLHSIEGEFDSARAEYHEALRLARESKNGIRIRELYDRLGGVAISVHDANAAQAYFRDLLDEVEKTGQNSAIANAYIGLGRTYQEFRNYQKANEFYDRALDYVDIESEKRQAFELFIGKVWAYIYLNAYADAQKTLIAAEQAATLPHNVYRVEVAAANLYLEQNQFQKALDRISRAESVIENEQWPMNWHWHVYHVKALSNWHSGDIPEAESSFRKAVAAVEALRENLSSSEDRAVFVHNKGAVYKNFAAFLEEQGRFGEAFHLTERARSRSLLDLLYTTQLERRASSNFEDLAIEATRQLRALAIEERNLVDMASESDASVISEQLRTLRRESRRADSVRAALDYSHISKLYTFDPVTARDAQEVLEGGEALVVYNLRKVWTDGARRNASVAYIVLKDKVVVQPLDVNPDDVGEAVKFLRAQIGPVQNGPGTGWEATSRRLYQTLVAPVVGRLPQGVSHLHLVPEGILHYLPFGALINEDDQFLIEKYSISVSPSVSILKLCREKNPRRWRSMLLLADPDGRLPGSRREVQEIAQQSPNRRFAFVGESATQDRLEENVSYYDVLHLATHGRFNRRAPWRSHLELSNDVLSVPEIGKLNLDDTYLVTLSACETALSGGAMSDIPDGDEWVGLNQAFLAAGAPSIMASLWPIDDQVSGKFMVSFYEHLEVTSKSDALAKVQREFLASQSTRHPFYWAAFTIIGDPL